MIHLSNLSRIKITFVTAFHHASFVGVWGKSPNNLFISDVPQQCAVLSKAKVQCRQWTLPIIRACLEKVWEWSAAPVSHSCPSSCFWLSILFTNKAADSQELWPTFTAGWVNLTVLPVFASTEWHLLLLRKHKLSQYSHLFCSRQSEGTEQPSCCDSPVSLQEAKSSLYERNKMVLIYSLWDPVTMWGGHLRLMMGVVVASNASSVCVLLRNKAVLTEDRREHCFSASTHSLGRMGKACRGSATFRFTTCRC